MTRDCGKRTLEIYGTADFKEQIKTNVSVVTSVELILPWKREKSVLPRSFLNFFIPGNRKLIFRLHKQTVPENSTDNNSYFILRFMEVTAEP